MSKPKIDFGRWDLANKAMVPVGSQFANFIETDWKQRSYQQPNIIDSCEVLETGFWLMNQWDLIHVGTCWLHQPIPLRSCTY